MNELNLTAKALELAPAAALPVFLNGIGWILKQTQIINNKWIPIILVVLGGALFPLIVEDGTVVWNSRVPWVYTAMIGCIQGIAAVGIYETVFKKIGSKHDRDMNVPDSANE